MQAALQWYARGAHDFPVSILTNPPPILRWLSGEYLSRDLVAIALPLTSQSRTVMTMGTDGSSRYDSGSNKYLDTGHIVPVSLDLSNCECIESLWLSIDD